MLILNKPIRFPHSTPSVLSAAFALFLTVIVGFSPVMARDSNSDQQGTLKAAFIEVTNGVFAVCQFDQKRGVLQRWNGVFVSKDQLPDVSRLRGGTIVFALGDRPTIPSDTKNPAAWNPSIEYFYEYGEIPYPIEVVDPDLVCYRDSHSELHVGFYFRNRFYSVTNLGTNALTESIQIKDIKKVFHQLPPWPEVVEIDSPPHREGEVQSILPQLRGK